MSGFTLPRLVFGAGSIAELSAELAMQGVHRPLLIADAGVTRAGLVASVAAAAPPAARFLDVPENPTVAAADAALAVMRAHACDGVVAVGGGSVLDTGKMVAAAAGVGAASVGELLGRPSAVTTVAPLVAVPTTLGTGSESSPVAALHPAHGAAAVGTRAAALVPRVALCDPDLTATLPARLVAATAVDALSHCIEGFLADPPHPMIDALALDGIRRVIADAAAAMRPGGGAARESLMAAAFAGGAAIHKGLGPAHAVALACGERDVHHGTLIGVALPAAVRLVAPHVPAKMARIAAAMGLADADAVADALAGFVRSLGLPATLSGVGFAADGISALAAACAASHFNRTAAYAPSAKEYAALLDAIA